MNRKRIETDTKENLQMIEKLMNYALEIGDKWETVASKEKEGYVKTIEYSTLTGYYIISYGKVGKWSNEFCNQTYAANQRRAIEIFNSIKL